MGNHHMYLFYTMHCIHDTDFIDLEWIFARICVLQHIVIQLDELRWLFQYIVEWILIGITNILRDKLRWELQYIMGTPIFYVHVFWYILEDF